MGILYHYTNLEGLVNMVETRTIWMSCLYYMNDKSEIVHAVGIANRIIDELARDSEPRRVLLHAVRDYLNGFLSRDPVNVFSFSLTPDGNLLSQWRAYTERNQGVSIGFDSEALERRAAGAGIRLHPCLYAYEDQKRELEAALLPMVEACPEGADPSDYLAGAIEPLMLSLCKVKNGLFYQENESRLISGYLPPESAGRIKYRVGRQFLIPYIDLDIDGLNEDGTLFRDLYVGPSEYSSLSMSSIVQFLRKHRACGEVKNSTLPLR